MKSGFLLAGTWHLFSYPPCLLKYSTTLNLIIINTQPEEQRHLCNVLEYLTCVGRYRSYTDPESTSIAWNPTSEPYMTFNLCPFSTVRSTDSGLWWSEVKDWKKKNTLCNTIKLLVYRSAYMILWTFKTQRLAIFVKQYVKFKEVSSHRLLCCRDCWIIPLDFKTHQILEVD